MESSFDCYSQKGTVIGKNEKGYLLRVERSSACGNCHMKGGCNHGQDSTLEVVAECNSPLEMGNEVELRSLKHNGRDAILLAFLIPLLVLSLTFFFTHSLLKNEAYSAIVSLIFVSLYYLFLLKNKAHLNSKFKIIAFPVR